MILAISLIASPNLQADQVTWIDKTTPAPFAGYLFPPAKAQEQRLITIENEANKSLVKSLNVSLDLNKKINLDLSNQNKILTESNDSLAKTAYQDRSLNNLERFGYFAIGIAATVFAVKLGQQLH